MIVPIIPGDGELAEKIGYTPDKYFGWMYLDEDQGYIYIGQIKTADREKGDFSALVRNINANGMKIKIVNPSNEMTKICIAKGLKPTTENNDIIWVQESLKW
jgi:hypothetical protein